MTCTKFKVQYVSDTEYECRMVIADMSTAHTKSADDEHGVVCCEHRHHHTGDIQRKIIQHRSLPSESVTSPFLNA